MRNLTNEKVLLALIAMKKAASNGQSIRKSSLIDGVTKETIDMFINATCGSSKWFIIDSEIKRGRYAGIKLHWNTSYYNVAFTDVQAKHIIARMEEHEWALTATNKQPKKKQPKKKQQSKEANCNNNTISNVSTDMLIDELIKRGYKVTLSK